MQKEADYAFFNTIVYNVAECRALDECTRHRHLKAILNQA